jgi:hypothetical protein
MSARPLQSETRAQLRAAISDAYYEARNKGRTMEAAADDAVEAIVPIVSSIDQNAHGRGALEALDALTAKLREVSKGEVETWGFVAMIHEMAEEVGAAYGTPA